MTMRAAWPPVKSQAPRFVTVLTVFLTACGFADVPSEERHPDLIGVVESMQPLGGNTHDIELEGGQELRLNFNDVQRLAASAPQEGDLLILGHDEELGDWYVALGGSDGCYGLVGPAEFRGEFGDGRMVFESGLSLLLADDFSPGRPSDPRVSERAHICVNEEGEVVSYSTT